MRFTIAFAILALSFSNAFAGPSDSWSAWVAEKVEAVRTKDTGIKEMTIYRDQTCSRQTEENKKNDCTSRVNSIISRRGREKELLLDMISVAALPDKQRNAKIPAMYTDYNKMDAETTQMANQVFALYHR